MSACRVCGLDHAEVGLGAGDPCSRVRAILASRALKPKQATVVHAPDTGSPQAPIGSPQAPLVVHNGSPQPADGSPQTVVHGSRHGVYLDPDKRRAYKREWARKRRAA